MIKTSILSALLMTSALLTSQAQAGFFDRSNVAKNIQSASPNDVYAGLKFNYLDKEDRLFILKDFLKTVELQYVLLPLKKELIGLDYKKMKAEALAVEEAFDDVLLDVKDNKNEEMKERITFLQASSNMDFLDRMAILVAKFKDTHFSLQEKIPRPFIYTGVRLFRIDGKIVVGSLEEKFLAMASKLSGYDLSVIKTGDEVLSIDGVPVEEKINEIKPYISGSSEEFIDSQAVRSLMLRNVKYEKKNYMRVVFKNAGTMKLPIFANNSMADTPRLDVITYLNKYKVPSDATAIGITFDQINNTWNDSELSYKGYNVRNLVKNLKGPSVYLDENGSAAIRTGYYMNKGKTYAVMQILTFSTTNVTKGKETLTFIDALRNFILEVKESEVPLILDLRVNNGGNATYPEKLLSMIIKEKDTYAPSTKAMRITQYMRGLFETWVTQGVVAEDENSGITNDIFLDLFDKALDARADYTPMYVDRKPITADPLVSGFNNKVVALVTADCISACDMTAFVIKDSKRATIIGSHSNGTGAGYYSSSALNTNWEDRLKVFSSTIPNFLFGKAGNDIKSLVFGDASVSELCTENKPTIADIKYSSTELDLTNDNLGWLKKAVEVLDSQKDVEVPDITVVDLESIKATEALDLKK